MEVRFTAISLRVRSETRLARNEVQPGHHKWEKKSRDMARPVPSRVLCALEMCCCNGQLLKER